MVDPTALVVSWVSRQWLQLCALLHSHLTHVQEATPAHLAAERGHAGIVEKLLLAGYVPDTPLGMLSRAPPGAAGVHGAQHAQLHPGQQSAAGRGQCAAGQGPGREEGAEAAEDGDLAGATALHLAAARGHEEVCWGWALAGVCWVCVCGGGAGQGEAMWKFAAAAAHRRIEPLPGGRSRGAGPWG